MTKDKGHIFVEYAIVAMVHMIYTNNTMGTLIVCREGYVTMKPTYSYVLYLFVDSSSLTEPKYQFIDVTIASQVINEFKFQQA